MMASEYTVEDIKNEILSKIFDYLSFNDRIQCKRTCRRWNFIIENLVFNSILISSNRHRSASLKSAKLCTTKLHQFTEPHNLFINLLIIERLDFVVDYLKKDNHLSRLRALKLDLDSHFELNSIKLQSILDLLNASSLLEHLELRCFLKQQQQFDYLNKINYQLTKSNRELKHLSYKKIQYMDFLYIDNLEIFEPLFVHLPNLTAFECDFCVLESNLYVSTSLKSSTRKQQLTKLHLPNANHLIGLIDDFHNLTALSLGVADTLTLNQLFSRFKCLERLEFKICEELDGHFVANTTIKKLCIHSLGTRENVFNLIQACTAVQYLTLINCLISKQTVQILIDNLSKSLHTLDIQNDYYDGDRSIGHLISDCFKHCTKLTNGHFKNFYLNELYRFICLLAGQNPNKLYSLHLDNYDLDSLQSSSLPANLMLFELEKDYNY